MRGGRNLLIALAVVVVLAIGGWYFLARGGSDAVEYRTAPAQVETLETTVSAVGKIQPREYVDVGAQVSGQLQRMYVEPGDKVEKGELLAEIDPTLLQTRVEESRARLEELDATLAQREANLALARGQAERNQRLLEMDAVSAQEAESTAAAYEIAKAQLAQIRASIRQTQSTLDANLANLNYTRIFAPIDGTVVTVSAAEGQTLNANQSAPVILRIADLTEMIVEADIAETDVGQLEPGMEARFNTLGRPEEKYTTELRQVLPEPEVVNDVVLYKALLDVDNSEEELLPNMSAQVFFVTGRAEDAVTIPVAALRQARGGPGGPPGAMGPQRPGGAPGRGAMVASASEGDTPQSDARGGSPERQALMAALGEARSEHPDARMRTILVMGADGKPQPRPVLVGLETRVSAEIVAGLEPGETVVTGIDTGEAPQAAGGGRSFRMRG